MKSSFFNMADTIPGGFWGRLLGEGCLKGCFFSLLPILPLDDFYSHSFWGGSLVLSEIKLIFSSPTCSRNHGGKFTLTVSNKHQLKLKLKVQSNIGEKTNKPAYPKSPLALKIITPFVSFGEFSRN